MFRQAKSSQKRPITLDRLPVQEDGPVYPTYISLSLTIMGTNKAGIIRSFLGTESMQGLPTEGMNGIVTTVTFKKVEENIVPTVKSRNHILFEMFDQRESKKTRFIFKLKKLEIAFIYYLALYIGTSRLIH